LMFLTGRLTKIFLAMRSPLEIVGTPVSNSTPNGKGADRHQTVKFIGSAARRENSPHL
jgi:hypothetical protein